MRRVLLLAWRYLSYYRVRTALLTTCVVLTFLLPFAVQLLMRTYGNALEARAAATPLVAGAKGSRYDLVLSSLYFRGRVPSPTSMAEVESLRDGGLALPIPLLVRHRAQGFPVVGTTPDYYRFRGLTPSAGTAPLVLGDVTLGARAASYLGLGVGDTLLSDRGSLYDLGAGYPLRMSVVGVLAETDGPDDRAVFVDVKTAWILDGVGHGHVDPAEADPDVLLEEREGETVFSAAVVEYQTITPDNIDSFHFHGEPETLPLTAVIAVPHDAKSSTLLKGRYRVSERSQLLVPSAVVDEILGFLVRIKRFFDANAALVTLATVLFLVLVVMLTVRVRRREIETLARIGCARATVFRVIATELALVIGTGLAGAAILAGGLVWFAGPGGWVSL